MRNIREYPIWDTAPFNLAEEKEHWSTDLLSMGMGALICLFAIGGPLDVTNVLPAGWAILTGIIVGITIGYFILRVSRIGKYYGLPTAGSYGHYYNFKYRAKEYYALPKSDRALYPIDIWSKVKDPNLTPAQLDKISSSMHEIYDSIRDRNRQREIMAAKKIDIDSIIDQFKDSVRNVEIETETYKEYMS